MTMIARTMITTRTINQAGVGVGDGLGADVGLGPVLTPPSVVFVVVGLVVVGRALHSGSGGDHPFISHVTLSEPIKSNPSLHLNIT